MHGHHADAKPSVESFLLDFAVHFCTCSQTVFCDRQFSSVANYCTLLHRENASFEVLSLQFCLTQCGVEQLLPSTVQELTSTPGACCFFPCCQFILVTRL